MRFTNATGHLKQDSWLVQRLEKPYGQVSGPFTFGGGLRDGGLTKEAKALLNDVFTFDYMGAAEFEFGAVPEALSAIYKVAVAGDLIAGSVCLTEAQVAKVSTWGRRPSRALALAADPTVYFICAKGDDGEAVKRIVAMARGVQELKESTMLQYALRPDPSDDARHRACGWLELDNGWFFFTDRTMFERVASLFEVSLASIEHTAKAAK